MLNDELEWDQLLILTKAKVEPELPEDLLVIMLRKNAFLAEFINHYDLQIEL